MKGRMGYRRDKFAPVSCDENLESSGDIVAAWSPPTGFYVPVVRQTKR